jgi:hypothetical protein
MKMTRPCPFKKGDWVRPRRGLWKGARLCVHDVFRGFDGAWWLNVTDSPRAKAHSWPVSASQVRTA